MSSSGDQIYVKSHVARDLLQNASLFRTDKLVVWEYVSNGLQYVDPGTNPVVRVTLDSRRKLIVVTDNGRGMDWAGLKNFFVMHGENLDRKGGRPGRGRFGTGKSAAFGIANLMRITTARDGRRSRVELSRTKIEKMSSEDPIPVQIIEREVETTQPNGTMIEIEGVHLKALDQPGIIHYTERHLARWPKGSAVFINNHECEFAEPPVAEENKFQPAGAFGERLGDVELVLKVSKSPLEEDLRGVSIFSNGVWHETTLAGNEGREMSQYIFGEIDVPRLDDDKSPIAPFDVSRSMRLNSNNNLVRDIYAFVGQKVEEVRRVLAETEKRRKSEEEAKRLAEQAYEIARVINEDFDAFKQRVAKARARAGGSVDPYQNRPPDGAQSGDDVDLLFGSELPADIVAPTGNPGATGGAGGSDGSEPRLLAPFVTPASPEVERRGQLSGDARPTHKPQGGFGVSFKNMGPNEFRALYARDERTIYINLDHPQLEAAVGHRSISDPVFKRLAYEIAFSEYAIALASELAARDNYIDPSDPIVDIRETLNRVARKAAALYSE